MAGAEILEPNPNSFGTGLGFDSPSSFGFGEGNENYLGIQVWGGEWELFGDSGLGLGEVKTIPDSPCCHA